MKWFKHMTDSLDDPFIQSLIDEFGHAGYVAWFGLIEIICKENGTKITGQLSINPKYLERKLRLRCSTLARLFLRCSSIGKLSVDFQKDLWIFQFNKILDIKDNYTKDLQASCKKLSNYKEVDVEEEAEADKEEEKNKDIVSPAKPSKPSRKPKLPDDLWIISLSKNEAYKDIDIKKELNKCIAWFENKGITVSRQRFLNWLNRADKPLMEGNNGKRGNTGIYTTETSKYAGIGEVFDLDRESGPSKA